MKLFSTLRTHCIKLLPLVLTPTLACAASTPVGLQIIVRNLGGYAYSKIQFHTIGPADFESIGSYPILANGAIVTPNTSARSPNNILTGAF